ncbi:MAG: helix-turn-helix domain-containing protein [Bacteroidetes bacterium]|nr:helix-turn-helix domain-containing protein [Bacteroidota bacterium]
MNIEVITKQDLNQLKQELLEEIRKLNPGTNAIDKKWLKTREVCKLLNCSPGTLQNLRLNGTLEYTKVGGTLYYSLESITKVLEANKSKAA